MGLLWVPNLSTGVEWQDKQHKDLFNRINNLLDAMKNLKGREELGGLFNFLGNYVIRHFHDEEAAMEKHHYPDSAGHKAQHEKFIVNVEKIRKRYEEENSRVLLLDAQKLLADWFYNHVAKVDKELGAFLCEKSRAWLTGS